MLLETSSVPYNYWACTYPRRQHAPLSLGRRSRPHMDLPDSPPQGFARHHPRIFREYPDSPARRSALSCLRVVGAPRVPAGATLLLGHGRGARPGAQQPHDGREIMGPHTAILIVEDEAGVRGFLADALRVHGYRAIAVGTVPEAEATRQRLGPGALTWSSPTSI
jgi:CheY-like chemotaxis protein